MQDMFNHPQGAAVIALIAAVLTTALHANSTNSTNPAIVRTDAGLVRGAVTSDHRSFEGIPYAAPPVGTLRWAAPQPAAHWKGTRSATKPGGSCPQTASFLGDKPSVTEDCLYLNVTTPTGPGLGERPVMVWIHGGGYSDGSGSVYDAHRLAAKGNVVMVTLNYRLGVFGFFAYPSLDGGGHLSGDYGLEDQQAALRWVRRNAAAFGGDPDNVTLFGESAGGVSICAQLTSPAARGLFKRVIVESGPCALTNQWPYVAGNWTPRPRAVAEEAGESLAARLHCKDIACLRGTTVPALLDASTGGQGYGPVVGGGVLPDDPVRAVTQGRFTKVPVIQGTTHDEQSFFVSAIESYWHHMVTKADYSRQIKAFFGRQKGARVLARYPVEKYGSPSLALATVWTDYSWGCTALETDRLLSRYVPTYGYEFADKRAPWPTDMPPAGFPTGAFHSSELQYLFTDELYKGRLTPAQHHLSDDMIRYWSRFAHIGKPAWAPFNAATQRVLSLAPGRDGIHPVSLAGEHQCGFWSSLHD